MNFKLKKSFIQAGRALGKVFPMILGTILLISLISALIPKFFYVSVFNQNIFFDSIVGSLIGSISAGNPITSYIFGGEMLNQGVGLIVVTAFLVSWVTVGLIQLPAESSILSKKFAIIRNSSSFVFAIIVAVLTVLILGVLK